MNASVAKYRRGACPGILTPMQTGDGWLLRIRHVIGGLSPSQIRCIARIVQAAGGGDAELTRRGSLQLRGFDEVQLQDAQRTLMDALGRRDEAAGEARRVVVAPPVADLDDAATGNPLPLARAIESALVADAGLQALPPKTAVVVDAGGAASVAGLDADIHVHLRGDRVVFRIGRAGVCVLDTPDKAVDTIRAVFRGFLANSGNAADGGRLRDRAAPDDVAAWIGRRPASAASLDGVETEGPQAPPLGVPERGRWVAVGFPFGAVSARALEPLADLAEQAADPAEPPTLRLSPWRALFIGPVDPARFDLNACAALGGILRPDDPRLRVDACVGAPGCSRSHVRTREDARMFAELADARGLHAAIHISGCAKRCGAPASGPVELEAGSDGYAVRPTGAEEPTATGLPRERAFEYALRTASTERNEPLPRPEPRDAPMFNATPEELLRDHLRDGPAIYRESFATIRAETDLDRFPASMVRVVLRLVHACGMPEVANHLLFSDGFAQAGQRALEQGAPILCDSEMVAHGVTRARLPANNEVVCTLRDERVPEWARQLGTTRSAAAMELWRDRLAGSVVAIGNAPTSLFRLLELFQQGAPHPAAVIGLPVGFVGAAESKYALAHWPDRPEYLTLPGRRGGSAMAAAVINALATEEL